MFDISGRLAVFENEDGIELTGFVTGAAPPRSGLGIIYLHGKGGNFYTGPGRFLSAGLADLDCLHLSMNMRCHDVGYTRYDMEPPDIFAGGAVCDGGAWERTTEGYKDVDAAIVYLRARGCERIVIVGHSSGGLYTGVYEDREQVVVGRVFLSPLMTSRTAFSMWFGSDAERERVRAQAAAMVTDGHGEQLIALPIWYYAISARSLLERIAEPADYFEAGLRQWASPTLVVWGEHEGRIADWRRVFGALTDRPCRLLEIPGTAHHYFGHEDLVTEATRGFLTELGVAAA
jgi:pimeloyl-ACP methyl ester carboxylesterase